MPTYQEKTTAAESKVGVTIFEQSSRSLTDQQVLNGVCTSLQLAGYPIEISIDEVGGDSVAIVSVLEADEKKQRGYSALVLGLFDATRVRLERLLQVNQATQTLPDNSEAMALAIASEILIKMVKNQRLMDDFFEYYGGLRWSSRNDNLIRLIYTHGSSLDLSLVDENFKVSDLYIILNYLGLEISYSERRSWDNLSIVEIFSKFPELNYHQLENSQFRKSEVGEQLEAAYASYCGEISYKLANGIEKMNISSEGSVIPDPVMPLSQLPVLEALVSNAAGNDKPRAKYDFSFDKLAEIAIQSDSPIAHRAVVGAVTSRLDHEDIHYSEGQDVFDHKQGLIIAIIQAYLDDTTHPKLRKLLQQDLVAIIDSYTGEGYIAQSVKKENLAYRLEAQKYGSKVDDTMEVWKVSKIIRLLIQLGIVAPDAEISSMIEDLITVSLSESTDSLVIADQLRQSRSILMVEVFNALQSVTAETQPDVVERIAEKVFQSEAIGSQVKDIAKLRSRAKKLMLSEERLAALKDLRKIPEDYSYPPNPSEALVAARARLYAANEPATQAQAVAEQLTNSLLLSLLEVLVNSGQIMRYGETARLFEDLTKHVSFRLGKDGVVPSEITDLFNLARHRNLTDRQRSNVIWHVQGRLQYVPEELEPLLLPLLIEMYDLVLGPISITNLPTEDTDLAFGGVRALVEKHWSGMFPAASQEELQSLGQYRYKMMALAEVVVSGSYQILDEFGTDDLNLSELSEEKTKQLRHLQGIIEGLQRIEKKYVDFIQIEAVKTIPSVYYSWVLARLKVFYRELGYAVHPDNTPAQSVIELDADITEWIKNCAEFPAAGQQEYPDNFNAVEQGGLGKLIKICYESMELPYAIKHQDVVWRHGLPFITLVISYMPEVVYQQLLVEHQGTAFASWLTNTYLRLHR